MTLGCAGYNNKQVTFWAYGIPYGLLQCVPAPPWHGLFVVSQILVVHLPGLLLPISLTGLMCRHDMVERFLLHYFAMSAHTCERSEHDPIAICASCFGCG